MRLFIIITLCLIGCLSQIDTYAQKPIDPYGEIGITGGYSYYIGDINPQQHFGPRKQLAYGGLYRVNLTKRHALRVQAMRMHIEAFDSDSDDPDLINRNLNFRNKFTELSLLLEINFHEYRLGKLGESVTPYLFGGLAYFQNNPEAELDGSYFPLIELGTEGQTAEGGSGAYSKNQISIPFGIGIKLGLTKRIAINLEWGIRRTYTDYLDDVSGTYGDPDAIREVSLDIGRDLADRTLQPIGPGGDNTGMLRGDPETRDWYIYSGLILSVRLGKDSNGCWK